MKCSHSLLQFSQVPGCFVLPNDETLILDDDELAGINKFEYDLSIADVPIGKATLKEATEVKGEGVGGLTVPIVFRPKDLGGALWDIIRGKGTGYSMVGAIEVDTPFGPMHLPFSKTSETTLQNKDEGEVWLFPTIILYGLK